MPRNKTRATPRFQLSLKYQFLAEKKSKLHHTLDEAIAQRQFHGTAYTEKLQLLSKLKRHFPVPTIHQNALLNSELGDNLVKQAAFSRAEATRRAAIETFDNALQAANAQLRKQGYPAYEAVQTCIRVLKKTRALLLDDQQADQLIGQLTTDLITSSKQFTEGVINYRHYQQTCAQALDTCNNTLPSVLSHKPHTVLQHLVNGLRTLFNWLDQAISWVTGCETMEKTSTPLAKLLTGRHHFFNRPLVTRHDTLQPLAQALELFDVPLCGAKK